MSDTESTQPNPKYAKAEAAADTVLGRLMASRWSAVIVGAFTIACVLAGVWIGW